MSRYIDADRVVDTLKRLRLVYSAEGQQQGAAALVTAIRIIEDARGYSRVDVRNQKLLPEWGAADDDYKAHLEASMSRELGKYAVEQGLATFEESPDLVGRELRMSAAFLQPIEPKFKPETEEEGEQE